MKKRLLGSITALIALSLSLGSASAHADGGSSSGGNGGGNFVGTQLLDDVDLQGDVRISEANLLQAVGPLLNQVQQKVPGFADKLRTDLSELRFYLDPKPLAQTGECRDNSAGLVVNRKVRSCQDSGLVRLDMAFFTAHPSLLPETIAHELLVRENDKEGKRPVGEPLFTVSRDIRDPNISADELARSIAENGFGHYMTAQERSDFRAQFASDICAIPARTDNLSGSAWFSYAKNFDSARDLVFQISFADDKEIMAEARADGWAMSDMSKLQKQLNCAQTGPSVSDAKQKNSLTGPSGSSAQGQPAAKSAGLSN